jgi:hypothetical protein
MGAGPRSVFDDQGHKHDRISVDGSQCVSLSIRGIGHIAGHDDSLLTVVVIFALPGQNIIGFAFSVMFVISQG